MKTVTLSGVISFENKVYSSWSKIKLKQEDGYLIDLLGRFIEAQDSYGAQVQVNYYVSDTPMKKDEITLSFLQKLYGYVDVEYDKHDIVYSSWTTDTEYTTTLRIGGHDLYKELSGKEGKFLTIELNFK